tara:strand:- start:1690 stop:1839 length:150 start_codon:yes stop_codon:yes gene_type:complete
VPKSGFGINALDTIDNPAPRAKAAQDQAIPAIAAEPIAATPAINAIAIS